MEKVQKLAQSLSLTDRMGRLSLSHAALTAAVVAVLIRPDWPTVAALVALLANYSHKRHLTAQAEAREAQATETSTLAKKVAELAALQESVATQAAETRKQHEEMKRVLSSSVLVNSFKPPVRRGQSHVTG